MIQMFHVKLNGESISAQVENVSIDYAVGRVINNASVVVTFDPSGTVGKNCEIVHGDNTFKGVVREFEKSSNLRWTLYVDSLGRYLAEPYFVDKESIAEATTATELCAEYAGMGGIPIDYQAVELDFGGSWVQNSVPADELLKLASVIGADIYDNGDGIVIENPKPVAGDAVELTDTDLLQVGTISDTFVDDGLGVVITRTSSARAEDGDGGDGSVVARNRISADVNDDTGRVKIYTTPDRDLDTYTGMRLVRTGYEYLQYSEFANNKRSVEVDGAILAIRRVTVNGAEVSNYHYKQGTGLLYFTTPVIGNVVIEYHTHFREFVLKIDKTPDGRFYHFTCTMLNQYLEASGFLNEKADVGFVGNDAWGYRLDMDADYVKGFYFYTYGDPVVELYDGAYKTSTVGKITATPGNFTIVAAATLTEEGSGYSFTLDVPGATVQSVTSSGVSISFSQNGDIVTLSSYHPDIEVEYEYSGIRYDVQYGRHEKQQTIVLNHEAEIPMSAEETRWWDPDTFPCGYPADFPFKIDELLNMKLEDVVGKTITGMTGPIDSRGICFAHITQDGVYEYDVSHISDSYKTITLRANSNGSLS